MSSKSSFSTSRGDLDNEVRLFVYRQTVRTGQVPAVGAMAKGLSQPLRKVRAALQRLSASHAFVLEKASGELWRAAPFSAAPTPFPVRAGKRSWWGTCIWDALGILAALHMDGDILASCGCCNQAMPLAVGNGRLRQGTDPHCRAGAALVRRRGLHLKDHAAVPVGTARGPLVPAMEDPARRHSFARPGLAPGSGLVWRSPQPALAAQDRAGIPGVVCRDRAARAILATEALNLASPQTPSSASNSVSCNKSLLRVTWMLWASFSSARGRWHSR